MILNLVEIMDNGGARPLVIPISSVVAIMPAFQDEDSEDLGRHSLIVCIDQYEFYVKETQAEILNQIGTPVSGGTMIAGKFVKAPALENRIKVTPGDRLTLKADMAEKKDRALLILEDGARQFGTLTGPDLEIYARTFSSLACGLIGLALKGGK